MKTKSAQFKSSIGIQIAMHNKLLLLSVNSHRTKVTDTPDFLRLDIFLFFSTIIFRLLSLFSFDCQCFIFSRFFFFSPLKYFSFYCWAPHVLLILVLDTKKDRKYSQLVVQPVYYTLFSIRDREKTNKGSVHFD